MYQLILQLVLAVVFGAVIGLERESKRRGAGLQTYSLVSLGACLFTILSFGISNSLGNQPVIQAVAMGIGFIGAGAIIYRDPQIEGVTTAAGLWCAAAIGVAVGAKFYFLSLISAVLAVIILIVFGKFEKIFFKKV